MGTLRFILAISVLYGHAGHFLGFPLIPGDTAVQSFYAVSGFYMTLVLNEKYRVGASSYSLFITNRFARLFPAYAAVMLLTLALVAVLAVGSASQAPFVARWRALDDMDWPSLAFLVISQIVIFGQDLYLFLTLQGGSLSFWPDFHTDPRPAYLLLVIPQAWTLGIELSFYLIAPFIVRRSPMTIAAVLAGSLLLRMSLQFGLGYSGDPWSYRFFPSELALFLVGALGYFVYRSLSGRPDRAATAIMVAAAACTCVALLINRWNGLPRLASVMLLLVIMIAIPFLFERTRNSAFDRYIGELSYPIYIGHFLVIWAVDSLAPLGHGVLRGAAIVGLTVLLSMAVFRWIESPVDAWRQRRILRSLHGAVPGTSSAVADRSSPRQAT